MTRYAPALLLIVLLVSGCPHPSAPPESLPPTPPTPAAGCGIKAVDEAVPDLEFTSLKGEILKLSDLKGRTVILDFWGMLCTGCVEGLDAYQKDPAFVGNPKLEILAISRDKSAPAVKKFAEEHGWTFPVVLLTPEIEKAFLGEGQTDLPQIRVIDGQGRLRYRLGSTEAGHETMKCLIGELGK